MGRGSPKIYTEDLTFPASTPTNTWTCCSPTLFFQACHYDEKAGDNYWADFSPLHDTLNIGTRPYVALLVEVKDATAKAKSGN